MVGCIASRPAFDSIRRSLTSSREPRSCRESARGIFSNGAAMPNAVGRPPKVRLRDAEPLQDYYRDRDGDLYSVARLLDDTKDLPVFEVPVAALDLSDRIWDDANIQMLAFHVKKCMAADLSCPILLDWRGGIADGRHRIIKAIATGKRTVLARRMSWKPEPDRKAETP